MSKKIVKTHKNKELILQTQRRFKSERRNVFTEESNVTLSSNDNNRMQSLDSIGTYAYGPNKDLLSEKEEIKYNNIIKKHKKLLTLTMLQMKT